MIAKKTEMMAKQSLNRMYKDSTGASKQEQIIKVFGSLWLPLAVISVAISTFSIYMDLSTPLGFTLSLVIGLFFAFVLVVFTHYALDSLFTTFTGLSKIMMGVIFLGLATISILTHFKSLNNFEKIMVQDKRVSILKMNMATSETANKQIKEVLATNQALTRVFNNGTIHDDKTAMQSISSNNQLITLLKTTTQNQTLQNEIIGKEKELAETLKDTLFLLFVVLEVMSYFSLVSKILLALNTSEEVKNLTTQLSKLEEIEANVYGVVVEKKTEQVTNTINQVLGVVSNPPTPSYAMAQNYQNQPNKAQIAFDANSGSTTYLTGVTNRLDENREKSSFLPIINKRKPTSSGTRNEIEDHLKENLNNKEKAQQKITEKEEKKVVDLLKFSHVEGEFIKLLWDNGEVKEGDKLIPKRFILEQSTKGRETERALLNLYAKLEDMNLIMFKNGYRALADVENVVTNKSE
jgi:hypothetical protein